MDLSRCRRKLPVSTVGCIDFFYFFCCIAHDADAVIVSLVVIDSGAFSLEGADNPGIVHKVTSLLAESGLNIDKLETDQDIAPHGGTVLFKMHGTAVHTAPLPRSFDIAKIKKDMEELGDSLNCEIKLGDATDDSYEGSFSAA